MLYNINAYFRKIIDDAGGPQEFAKKLGWSEVAIEEYYKRTRQIQHTTLMELAEKMELWKQLIE